MENLTFKQIIILGILLFLVIINPQSFAIEEAESGLELPEQEAQKVVSKIDFGDVLKKAKEHSYDLKIADYNILISKQGVRGARSEYFPKLNFGAGTEYTKNFRDAKESTVMSIGEAFINPYTRFQSVMGITVGYNLWPFLGAFYVR